MRKLFQLLLFTLFLFHYSYAQKPYFIKGTVCDENDKPLAGASVFIYPAEKGTVSDKNGNFVFENLPKGNYIITISYIGYKTFVDSIRLDQNVLRNFHPEIATLSLQEVLVTDKHTELRKREETLNLELVNDDFLKQNLGGSLMNSLERLPGVTTINIGSGQSKPVIRGLGFNRVVVVENNIKHQAQQWGADHGLEIDQFSIDNIEVIKGPASLMYGSDALGGVIDLRNRKLPSKQSFGGSIDISGKSNNDFIGSSVSLFGRGKLFYANLRATLISYGDYKVPTDSIDIYSYRAALYENQLRNTAGKEQDLHASFGIIRNDFHSKFHLSNVSSKSGFFANAHGLEPRNVDTGLHDSSNRDIQYPYQTVNHFKVVNNSLYRTENWKFELNLGFQRNFREEWSQYTEHGYMPAVLPENLSFNPDLERAFRKYVYSANGKSVFTAGENTQFDFGLSSEFQNNITGGRGFIIPDYRQVSLGSIIVAKHHFSGKSMVQAGFRYDFGAINTSEHFDWFATPIIEEGDTSFLYLQRAKNVHRRFSNLTWSAGYNFNSDKWLLKANVGKSFRMPIAKELAANGVNYHHFSYEVGDAELDPEISYQLDAGVEYCSRKFAIGGSPFVNYFSNYIYLNPTSEHDRLYGNGNQVFYYTQSRVFRYGAELHAHYELLTFIQLGLIGEYVHSVQLSGEKKGFTLPFSPPASAILNLKYHKEKLKFAEDVYLSVDFRFTAAQNNIVPPEETTPGYQLINLAFGGDVTFKKQTIGISMQLKNLLNTKYFNHTDFYRLINVPDAGRNFILNISIPFSSKFN